MSNIVVRDGAAASPLLANRSAALAWLLKHQPMSTDWALAHEGYAILSVVMFRWQYCQGGSDITGEPYAERDADLVRAWEGAEGDFCLLEATWFDDRWAVTGGDGNWSPLADQRFADPAGALAAYGALTETWLIQQS